MEPTLLTLEILVLLFSVILHEVMHGVAARYFGDHTAEHAGRLTLNPIPHIDPIGTLLLPALLIISGTGFIIGWAKPVPVNPFNFSNLRKGELFTSLAGVASNFALAIVGAILFHLLAPILISSGNTLLVDVLRFTVTINLILGIFNSLPIPPLDGYKVLLSELPLRLSQQLQQLERYGLLILFLLWFVPIGGRPLLSFILGNLVNLINSVLQVPLKLF